MKVAFTRFYRMFEEYGPGNAAVSGNVADFPAPLPGGIGYGHISKGKVLRTIIRPIK